VTAGLTPFGPRALIAWLKRTLKRLHDENDSGAAMTEFAIVFPAQFFVTLAIMQFGLILIGHLLIQHAAYSAARAALVGDIPTSGGTATNNAQEAAEKAATFVLAPIAPEDDEVRSSTNPQKGFAVKLLSRTKGAWEHTKVTVDTNNASYVSAIVDHDFRLAIPVVNHWFASRAAGFMAPAGGAAAYNAESQSRKITVLKIRKAGYVPRPWKVK
jgi:Flp pilus assembly protein TadG